MNDRPKNVLSIAGAKKRTNAMAIADALAKGYPPEHAHVIGDIDAALEGHDASVALPVLILIVDNIAAALEPAAQQQVARLMSEAAFQIAERARETQQAAAREAAQPTGENHGDSQQVQQP